MDRYLATDEQGTVLLLLLDPFDLEQLKAGKISTTDMALGNSKTGELEKDCPQLTFVIGYSETPVDDVALFFGRKS